ncbi:MAG: WG repeat-containing protein, partial [Oscillospiraceae bacterium]|nr:WG repeat-containing protein [Oscillospiraceae bacterium]
MKQRILSLSLALLMALSLFPSSVLAAEEDPQRGGLSYEEIISPQYEDASTFSEDLAAVKKDGKWGYINEQNEVIIPFRYAYAWPFSEGKAIVCLETKTLEDAPNVIEPDYSYIYSEYRVLEFGFIDTEGNYTPFQFGYAGEADEDEVEPYYLNLSQEYSTATYTEYVFDFSKLDYTDEIQYTEVYDDWQPTLPEDMPTLTFLNGAALIGDSIYDSTGRRIVIHTEDDNSNSIVQGPVFRDCYPFICGPLSEGLIPFQLKGLNYYLAGYADATGKVVKQFDYEYTDATVEGAPAGSFTHIYSAYPFNDGLALAYQGTYQAGANPSYVDRYYGFIDRSFNWVIPPQYHQRIMVSSDTYAAFSINGLAYVRNADGLFGVIDKEGNAVLPFQYEELWPDNEGFILFKQD